MLPSFYFVAKVEKMFKNEKSVNFFKELKCCLNSKHKMCSKYFKFKGKLKCLDLNHAINMKQSINLPVNSYQLKRLLQNSK